MEVIVAIAIGLFAAFIIYKNIKKSSKGDCNCGSCSSHCSKYKEDK